jgi:hypothetical protein
MKPTPRLPLLRKLLVLFLDLAVWILANADRFGDGVGGSFPV